MTRFDFLYFDLVAKLSYFPERDRSMLELPKFNPITVGSFYHGFF